ncbi:3-isopropylmalate dehydratase small subunit [Flavobacteriaceae bacterium]|jgi:3-isopropylmalate/(R)-2-methylmalate dehydratase small subunit|nr:3-isopropylmalate dehydratase small subunit [Flavobacteriaceae bacterium]MDB4133934.1 3-isopropylmalate dehydratase small subunit [Flavobacteriaceae bacterium]MDB4179652.1 3-isopropylmalate dehydratase small subunit [Flavobacteriaceae bacterium]MDC0496952.1 3-isopropylmalate dehydratase small subunit [Flavobacteriaceae bacterium]MDC0552523.1 3-isopropylmalate dehydratase small subunit [Flavobacteriaceae bacterium]|tara:strand:- start:2614 stop:3210 length:597 start_codon:yes stop_codon:yes gene_type:complete
MAYDKFTTLKSTCIPLPIENVDTDQIIPARFLKAIERKGFGDNLFRDWRYNSDNSLKEDFVLNNPTFNGKILIGGKNFGSGSSREHAAWSIYDYGFRCVISSFFADIFSANCLNVGVLPVRVSENFLNIIFENIYKKPSIELCVDLLNQSVSIPELDVSEPFTINGYKKNNMLNGYDDIDYLMSMKNSITDFASKTPL